MRWLRLLLGAGLVLLLGAEGVAAQRAPVLRQIKVPHPYYFREMLIPQATSGPSAAAWSPNGEELVYSMQGSLWRQRVGSEEARQLTSGPGYDYQPDWSPDGRRVLYASYRDDAIELRLLDLATGASAPLVSNGAVNIEPRWSPDGRRIAFTSTAYEGRWHVFIARVMPDGRAGGLERVTEDRQSELPRYYYHRFDQYLSPSWSPDGSELLLVSNRGRIWGSGGFWRTRAAGGGEPREIHYEETTWKARPDWSPDGRRVVYSSYLGRQWNQLWLMTAEGGDPLQLTYGDFDATAPRWSRDGRRIAYVSNEGGNTSLWVVDVPGSGRREVRAVRRVYREPVGRLSIMVVDRSTGRPVPARVSVTGPDGRSYAPDDAWRHADDGFDRSERRFEYGYFHTGRRASMTVPAGAVTVEVSRGPEFRVASRTVKIADGAESGVRIALERLADLPAQGWYSGDLHVHMNYGGAYRNDPARLALQARAEDLHVVENLIVNKEGRVPDVEYFRGTPDPVSSPGTLIMHGQEYHTSFWGHAGLLGMRENLVLPGYTAYTNTAMATLQPTNAAVFDMAHAQGGVTGYVHPFDVHPEPGDTSRPLTHEFPVDVALGKVDYYEAVGFVDDPMATAAVWYRILNCGFRLPAGAGTDAMANFASLRGPVGLNRVFVRSGAPLEHRRWLAALVAGRSFATNGPLLEFTLGGRGLGEEVSLPAGTQEVVARVGLRSNVPIDHLEIVSNGRVLREIPLAGDRTAVTTTVRLPVSESGWYLLRARSDRAIHPVLDLYPYATTSPIYLTVGGKPIRSREDAEYFMAWIARLQGAAEGHREWNTPEEKSEALAMLAAARAEFERRAALPSASN
ncbi:MAG: CehA/McbA family metallohydrolase [Gemmatimonadales bacterium]|nr:CehA/McbA family metallohydrolase [Gemmatimonadales bacterium]MDQ3427697.1 CehA/McbA family metallohydrolase [Gemmatimonadota bacterium]